MQTSTTTAFRNILTTFQFDLFQAGYEERFAIKRFSKKMEVPNQSLSALRKQKCFDEFINFDCSLPSRKILKGKWYLARLKAHEALRSFSLQPIDFTNGSEVFPTRGRNSIQSKLSRSVWACTPDCWDLWAEIAYKEPSIRRACRQRFSALMGHNAELLSLFHSESWIESGKHGYKDRAFFCFKRTLSLVTHVSEASRFSTVRKNNEVDRPIDIQPLCNILVQRSIGIGIRKLLLDVFNVDLPNLAEKHGRLVKDASLATIDLKNASDSVTKWLCEFMFPKHFYNLLDRSRSEYTLGLDGHYWSLNKISSMGNGFTFELMTLIILLVGRETCERFSVFGDDIICDNKNAQEVIDLLSDVGFVVNTDKSFINSKFRESCGANFHDDFGYLKSFDFEYPKSIMDCIIIFNKLTILSPRFPQFRRLRGLLSRTIPPALRGTAPALPPVFGRGLDQDNIDHHFFWFHSYGKGEVEFNIDPHFETFLRTVLNFPYVFTHKGYRYDPKELSRVKDVVSSTRDYGKYLMYLHGGRKVKDIITGQGNCILFSLISDGSRTFRYRDLLKLYQS